MDFIQAVKEVKGMIVQIVVPLPNGDSRTGSGFWVNQRGYIATCWHVVRDNPKSTITVQSAIDPLFDLKTSDISVAKWETFQANVIAKDENNDLALLKVDRNPFAPRRSAAVKIHDKILVAHYKEATLNTDLPEAGQKIFLAGYPLGQPYPFIQEGSIASVAHSLPEFGKTLKIVISAVANPGNSGAPVLDSSSRVIGVFEGGLPSRHGLDAARAPSGFAVVVPAHFLLALMNTVRD